MFSWKKGENLFILFLFLKRYLVRHKCSTSVSLVWSRTFLSSYFCFTGHKCCFVYFVPWRWKNASLRIKSASICFHLLTLPLPFPSCLRAHKKREIYFAFASEAFSLSYPFRDGIMSFDIFAATMYRCVSTFSRVGKFWIQNNNKRDGVEERSFKASAGFRNH